MSVQKERHYKLTLSDKTFFLEKFGWELKRILANIEQNHKF